MQCNVIRNGDVLTAETFPDLKKYLENNVVSLDSLIERQEEGRIHKLIIKDAKCNMPIKEIKHFLKEYLILNELKEIEIVSEDKRFCTIDGMLYSKDKRRLYLCPCGRKGVLVIPDGTDKITVHAAIFQKWSSRILLSKSPDMLLSEITCLRKWKAVKM